MKKIIIIDSSGKEHVFEGNVVFDQYEDTTIVKQYRTDVEWPLGPGMYQVGAFASPISAIYA